MPLLFIDIAIGILLTIFIFAVLETGRGKYGFYLFLTVAAYTFYLWWTNGFTNSFFSYITWQNALKYVPAYFVCGAIYAVGRWQAHLWQAKRWFKENETKVRTCEWFSHGGFDPEMRLRFDLFGSRKMAFVQGSTTSATKMSEIQPLAREFKRKIMDWIVFWPWSALWYFINDPITRLVKAIFNWLASLLQRMSANTFRDA
jgi:hypothetical protein